MQEALPDAAVAVDSEAATAVQTARAGQAPLRAPGPTSPRDWRDYVASRT